MSQLTIETYKARVTVQPVDLAVSLEEAKQQVNWPTDDTSQDAKLTAIIERSTAEFEHDTGLCLVTRTLELKSPALMEYRFSERPIASITHIKYYDSANTLQTWSSANYSVDIARNQLRFISSPDLPTVYDRWDAVTITYVAGSATETAGVPQQYKQPVLLLVGYYLENPDMLVNDIIYSKKPYEALVAKLMRSTYP